MKFRKIKSNIFLIFLLSLYSFFLYIFFKDLFYSNNIILDLDFKKIDFCNDFLLVWKKVKKLFIYSNILIIFLIYFYFTYDDRYEILKEFKELLIQTKNNKRDIRKEIHTIKEEKMQFLIGFDENKEEVFIDEGGLFQNILITGSIGTGKTQSAMLPILQEFIGYKSYEKDKKLGMLILDVKGNFAKDVKEIAENYGRKEDVIEISLGGKYKYNPVDKKELKPQILGNRLKTILLLLSPENSELYWIDKSEQLITEVIKFIRIYNEKYVSFEEISKVIFNYNYYIEQKKKVDKRMLENKLREDEIYNYRTFLSFFTDEFLLLDERTKGIIKSEISRITNIFISDYEVNKTFCPKKEEINFKGFKDVIDKGKIVVLNMNLSKNTIIAKIIATYLKLDFQTEVLSRFNNKKIERKVAFICDEYQEYVSKIDASFYAQSREAKCITAVATQSYSSILNTLKDKEASEVIFQNLINKIWFRNDDKYTVESAITQIGKENKIKRSLTISENSKESEYNPLLKSFIAVDSNLSESINKSMSLENVFETKDFSQELKTFEAIVFISDGEKVNKPKKVKLVPYFKRKGIL